jgi:hypothetical protein
MMSFSLFSLFEVAAERNSIEKQDRLPLLLFFEERLLIY